MLRLRMYIGLALVLTVAALPSAAQNARVTVAHGIPGADVDPSLDPVLPVDVLVNDEICLLTGFTFGEFAGPVELPAGDYDIEIKLANPADPCGNPTAIGPATVPFQAGENATVIAHLAEDGALTASKFVDDLSGLGVGLGRVVVHHTAAAPAVDIKLRRDLAEIVVPDFANGDQAAAEVRPGEYELTIGPAGQGLVVFGPATVRFRPFQVSRVYAVGSLDNATFTLLRNDVLVTPAFLSERFGPFLADRPGIAAKSESKLATVLRSLVDRWRARFN